MFEKKLEKLGIIYHRIRVATPRHNGKVERQHRCDELRFYKKMKMYNLEDGRPFHIDEGNLGRIFYFLRKVSPIIDNSTQRSDEKKTFN